MRNLILLIIGFIIINYVALLFHFVQLYTGKVFFPTSIGEFYNAALVMFMMLFWCWVATYSCWIIASLALTKYFKHSILRSVIAGATLPIAYIWLLTTWFLIVWHLLLGVAFGYLFHKFVYNNR